MEYDSGYSLHQSLFEYSFPTCWGISRVTAIRHTPFILFTDYRSCAFLGAIPEVPLTEASGIHYIAFVDWYLELSGVSQAGLYISQNCVNLIWSASSGWTDWAFISLTPFRSLGTNRTNFILHYAVFWTRSWYCFINIPPVFQLLNLYPIQWIPLI